MSASAHNAVRLCLLSMLGLLASACDQPSPKCSIARGNFAAKYTLMSGTGECATLVGENIGVDVYYQPVSKKDPQPDLDHTSIALQPESLANVLAGAAGRVEANPDDHPYAFGPFEKSDPTDEFCTVVSPTPARVRLPEIPEQMDMCTDTPPQPAVDVSYSWSNIKIYLTAGAYGTQFGADLTYAKDGCTATYRVTAVYPSVPCGIDTTVAPAAPATEPDSGAKDAGISQGMDASADMDAGEPGSPDDDGSSAPGDEAGDGACPPAEAPAAPQIADDTLCSPNPDLSKNRATGSGINPDFATACDPNLLLCVLKSEPPSLR